MTKLICRIVRLGLAKHRGRARLLLQLFLLQQSPAQEGPLPPEPQAAVSALAAAASAASAGAAAAAADTEDDEPGVVPADLLAVSRRAVKRMRRSLEITHVNFGIYDKSQVQTPLEHVVLIFPDLSLADAGNQLCCAVFFRNIWAGGYIIISQSRGNISLVHCICREAHGTE